ncbi:MAG: flagellar FliJ family protein, partial [Alphaproteobacteria bacterium]|nr:flagellar FliJ family protein [Alphaproteobacteria bacterium]
DVYESTYTYGAYLAEARLRRAVIEACIKMLQDEARKAHDEVAEAFAELKKYEITQENRDRQAQEEANRREQDSLDEMGLAMFRRKNTE